MSGKNAELPALVADAVEEALKPHCPDPGSAGSYPIAMALWVAMNMLLGPDSARHFVVFLAGQFLEDFELKGKGVM